MMTVEVVKSNKSDLECHREGGTAGSQVSAGRNACIHGTRGHPSQP